MRLKVGLTFSLDVVAHTPRRGRLPALPLRRREDE